MFVIFFTYDIENESPLHTPIKNVRDDSDIKPKLERGKQINYPVIYFLFCTLFTFHSEKKGNLMFETFYPETQ